MAQFNLINPTDGKIYKTVEGASFESVIKGCFPSQDLVETRDRSEAFVWVQGQRKAKFYKVKDRALFSPQSIDSSLDDDYYYTCYVTLKAIPEVYVKAFRKLGLSANEIKKYVKLRLMGYYVNRGTNGVEVVFNKDASAELIYLKRVGFSIDVTSILTETEWSNFSVLCSKDATKTLNEVMSSLHKEYAKQKRKGRRRV